MELCHVLVFDEKTMEDNNQLDLIPCGCGCDELIKSYYMDPRRGTKRYPRRFKRGHHMRGSGHWIWKGGKYITSKGYYYKLSPTHHFANKEGYVMEHRLVWEEYHNAVLLPWGDIHHKDHNKLNNKIKNLDAMIHGKHTTLTNTKDFSNIRCCYCDNSTHIKKNGKPMWYHDKNDWEKFVCKRCYDGLHKGYFKPLGYAGV